jgi:hypothetical protein
MLAGKTQNARKTLLLTPKIETIVTGRASLTAYSEVP